MAYYLLEDGSGFYEIEDGGLYVIDSTPDEDQDSRFDRRFHVVAPTNGVQAVGVSTGFLRGRMSALAVAVGVVALTSVGTLSVSSIPSRSQAVGVEARGAVGAVRGVAAARALVASSVGAEAFVSNVGAEGRSSGPVEGVEAVSRVGLLSAVIGPDLVALQQVQHRRAEEDDILILGLL